MKIKTNVVLKIVGGSAVLIGAFSILGGLALTFLGRFDSSLAGIFIGCIAIVFGVLLFKQGQK